jgi:hypothetical protein
MARGQKATKYHSRRVSQSDIRFICDGDGRLYYRSRGTLADRHFGGLYKDLLDSYVVTPEGRVQLNPNGKTIDTSVHI